MDDRPIVLTVGVSDTMLERMRHAALIHGDFRLLEADSESEAVSILNDVAPNAVMINLGLRHGSPMAVADYVMYRRATARVIYEMGGCDGFEDGSIFAHSPNVHGVVTQEMATRDVAAVVAHHAMAAV